MVLPDYVRYWGLTRLPFSLTPDPTMLYLSRQHRECLLRLQYAVLANKGGALLVSENAGDGKTTVLSRLVGELDRETGGKLRVAVISHPTLSANQFIAEIGRQMGIPNPPSDKIQALTRLREHLEAIGKDGYRALVVVDEGQMLAHRPDILQEFRILLNLCQADTFLLSLVLSGQKPLEGALREMPEFWQRLSVRFFLRNLDGRDSRELVRFRLAQAGADGREIVTPAAHEKLFRYSEGVPRVLCSLADLALVVGASARARAVDDVEVNQAWRDMESKDGSAGEFHYFHFLRSIERGREEEPDAPAAATPEPPPAPEPAPAPEATASAEFLRCVFCQEENDTYAAACSFCGETIPADVDEADLSFLAALEGAAGFAEDLDRVAIRAEYELEPGEAILALAGGGVLRYRIGEGDGGAACRVLLTTRRIFFVLPREIRFVLPMAAIESVRLGDLRGRRALALSAAGTRHRLLFDAEAARTEAPARVLVAYLLQKTAAVAASP